MNMIQTLLGWFLKISYVVQYIIAPPLCYACRSFIFTRSILCDDCDAQLISVAPKLLQVNSSYTMIIHAICKYDDPLKRLILAKHYSESLMFQGLADLMWQKTVLPHLSIDCFVPIPLYWSRKMKRGFNQAELLAKRLGSHGNIAVYDMVVRIKKTEYQARLDRPNRKENVLKAFMIKDGFDIEGKHVMLVDDLCTTGSTAVAVAKILAMKKPASIGLVVACRAL